MSNFSSALRLPPPQQAAAISERPCPHLLPLNEISSARVPALLLDESFLEQFLQYGIMIKVFEDNHILHI
jgi:hypothetical protein